MKSTGIMSIILFVVSVLYIFILDYKIHMQELPFDLITTIGSKVKHIFSKVENLVK